MNTKINTFWWHVRKFYKKTLIVGDGKTTSSKFKTFGYSMLFAGILIISLLWAVSGDPFTNLGEAFKKLTSLQSNIDRFLINLSVFGLAGIAVAIGFKTGLFNMGVSGQMMFGGTMAGLVALHAGQGMPMGVGQLVVFIVAVISAMSFSVLSGVLKAYFRIHEVVSTILLNWIAFFLMQAIVKNFLPDNLLFTTKTQSIDFAEHFQFRYSDVSKFGTAIKLGGAVALGLLIASAIVVWVIIYKTTLGHKMLMVGKNKDAALAAGVNVKLISIASMALSGAISGVLGVVTFFIRDLSLKSSLVDAIPAEGFNGIAIAILSFSNPIAILPVAAIFGLLQALIVNSVVIDNNFVDLTIGILLMITAISSLFLNLNARLYMRKLLTGKVAHERYLKFIESRNEIDKKHYEHYENLKLEKAIKENSVQIQVTHNQELNDIKNEYLKEIKIIRQEINFKTRFGEFNKSFANRFKNKKGSE